MKKITFLITLFTLSVGFGQNLLSGGDLEGLATGKITSATSPWSSSVANSTFQSSINNNSAIAYQGDQFINMGNDFTNFRQSFTATPSTEYTLGLWNQFVSGQGQPDATDGIFVSIRQDTGGNGTNFDPAIVFYIDPSTIDANWHEFTLDFTAPQANLLLFVTKQARAASGPNNAARMDLISIVEKALSVTDLEKFNFSASPNPAKDIVRLSANQAIQKVEIYSILGQQVLSKDINELSTDLNISDLSKGIYVVRTQIDNAVGSYKLIKE
jgi:hypothetical protein